MNTYQLITKRRTIRRFKQKKINQKILFNCLNAARLAPSASNLQPLEYILVTKDLNQVFSCTKWAGYLKDGAPQENERPVAYIIILSNIQISKKAQYDVGLAVENIVLTALEKGIASCIIGSVNRNKLTRILQIPKNYLIELIIALGYPQEKSVAEEMKKDIKYWLDEKKVLHIPKRKLKNIVHEEKF